MSRPLLCHLLSWALAGAAWAADPSASLEGRTRVDLDLTVANRDSTQKGLGTTLKFAGFFTPGYLHVTATHFFHPVLGVSADLGADLFGVTGDGFRAQPINQFEHALQGSASVVGRARVLESLSLEGQ